MLHFFTEAFDMVKIDEFFSKQLISSMDVKCAGLLKISETEKSIYEDYKRSNPLYDTDVKYKMYGDINDDTCKLLLETFTSDAFIERLSDGHTYICNNVKHSEYSIKAANELTYPVLLRPSYVLGGQNMIIAFNEEDVREYM